MATAGITSPTKMHAPRRIAGVKTASSASPTVVRFLSMNFLLHCPREVFQSLQLPNTFRESLISTSDIECRLCFALCLWNEKDPILKERLYGLTGPEGNHGEVSEPFLIDNIITPSKKQLCQTDARMSKRNISISDQPRLIPT